MLVLLQGIEQIREHICHIIRDWLVLNCHSLWIVCLGYFEKQQLLKFYVFEQRKVLYFYFSFFWIGLHSIDFHLYFSPSIDSLTKTSLTYGAKGADPKTLHTHGAEGPGPKMLLTRGAKWPFRYLDVLRYKCRWAYCLDSLFCQWCTFWRWAILDSIAVSVFAFILVDFDIFWEFWESVTSRLVKAMFKA